MKAILTVALLALTPTLAIAQPHPDLQGVWDFGILTPLQRPKEANGKPYFTDEEAIAFERGGQQRFREQRGEVELQTSGEVNGLYADVRPRQIGADRRSSLIVDPPDGLVPALTPEGKARVDQRTADRKAHPADGPEDLPNSERCLLWGGGPPLIPAPYNNYLQIVQTPDNVLLATEMVHDARVVPITDRAHLPAQIRRWQGDPRGRWDGDTLVVETTNFTGQTPLMGSSADMRVVERFTRTGPNTIRYQFTVDDPGVFTKPWSGEYVMTRVPGPLLEYACHEGNYSMVNILKGARLSER